jgi:hypothetical protein
MDVFITTDVEHGGAAYARAHADPPLPPATLDCDIAGRPYGLPFIVQTLRENGLKGTFFVEPFAKHYYGEKPMGDAVQKLLEAGMDVQLHAHPAWLSFADGRPRPDALHAFTLSEQAEILASGKRILEGYGATIHAFRAGGFAADNGVYPILKDLGFTFSSSYNLSWLGSVCKISQPREYNDPFAVAGLVEVPITNYLIRDPRKVFGYARKHFQIGNTSVDHGIALCEKAHASGMRCVNLLLHNFEFVRRNQKAWFLKPLVEHKTLVKGFQKLCAYLAAHPERFTVRTFGTLEANYLSTLPLNPECILPKVPGIYWPL